MNNITLAKWMGFLNNDKGYSLDSVDHVYDFNKFTLAHPF